MRLLLFREKLTIDSEWAEKFFRFLLFIKFNGFPFFFSCVWFHFSTLFSLFWLSGSTIKTFLVCGVETLSFALYNNFFFGECHNAASESRMLERRKKPPKSREFFFSSTRRNELDQHEILHIVDVLNGLQNDERERKSYTTKPAERNGKTWTWNAYKIVERECPMVGMERRIFFYSRKYMQYVCTRHKTRR